MGFVRSALIKSVVESGMLKIFFFLLIVIWTDFHFLPTMIPKSSAMILNKIFARVLDLVSFQKKTLKKTRQILDQYSRKIKLGNNFNFSSYSRNLPMDDFDPRRWKAMEKIWWISPGDTWQKNTNKVKSAKSSTTTRLEVPSSFFFRWWVWTDKFGNDGPVLNSQTKTLSADRHDWDFCKDTCLACQTSQVD